MSMIADLLSSLFPIMAPIGLGYLCKKISLFSTQNATLFRSFAVKVTVPFLIFKTLSRADLAAISQAVPAAFGFLTISLLFAVSGFWFAKVACKDPIRRATYVFATFVGNYAFLGWSVLYIFWGEAALTRAVFFSMLFWPGFLMIGFFMVRLLGKGEHGTVAPIMRLLLHNAAIPIATVIVALGCNYMHIAPPKPVWMFIEQFAGITVPLILFAVGLSLRIWMPGRDIKVILLASTHRLLLGGLIGWLVVLLARIFFTVDPLTTKVIFLQATMPTATMSPFFAEYIRMDDRLLAAIIAFSTLLSLITLPLWRLLLDLSY